MAFSLFKKPKPKPAHKKAPKPVKRHITRPVKKASKKPIAHKVVHKPAPKVAPKPVVHVAAKPKLPEIIKMDDEKAYDLVRSARLPVLKTIFIKKEADVELIKKFNFPCFMKVSGTKIIHKTELNGVTKVGTFEEALITFKRLMKIKGAEKVIIQEFKETGIELIVGAKSDAQFGHIVSIGLGGTYVEILKDVTFRICPISPMDADQMIKELKGYDILAGARGAKPVNFPALIEFLTKMCSFSIKNEIKQMDLNPVFCDDKGCYIADVRIIK